MAEQHRLQGNKYFADQLYDKAIQEYTSAIIKNPNVATYFNNRGLCHLKLCQYEQAISDCRKAIELDSNLLKGYYFLGQALLATDTFEHVSEAVPLLKKAYTLSLEQPWALSEEICQVYLKAKKKKWAFIDEQRRNTESDLYRYLNGLLEREKSRLLHQAGNSMEELVSIQQTHRERLHQIDELFMTANDPGKQRDVPDFMCGKIWLEIMKDPVITPSGVSYDRTEILQHLEKVGHFDPFTRKPLHATDLIPNLALKEAIDDFISKNPWATEF